MSKAASRGSPEHRAVIFPKRARRVFHNYVCIASYWPFLPAAFF
jgi:hypothetical protein